MVRAMEVFLLLFVIFFYFIQLHFLGIHYVS